MPNGKPGDHPLTDLLVHGRKVFPSDMEELIRRLHKTNKEAFSDRKALRMLCQWELGKELDEGRAWLRSQLGMQDE